MEYIIEKSGSGKKVVCRKDIVQEILTDKNGREYFFLPHTYVWSHTQRIRYLLKEQDADMFITPSLFRKRSKAIRYLDRDYGDKVRQRTVNVYSNIDLAFSDEGVAEEELEGVIREFSEVDYDYVVQLQFRASYDGNLKSTHLLEGDNLKGVIRHFATEADAEKYIVDYQIKAKEIFTEYEKIQASGDLSRGKKFRTDVMGCDSYQHMVYNLERNREYSFEVEKVVKFFYI